MSTVPMFDDDHKQYVTNLEALEALRAVSTATSLEAAKATAEEALRKIK